MTDTWAIIAAVVGGVVALARQIHKHWADRRIRDAELAIEKALRTQASIHHYLQQLCFGLKADRVCLLKATNGGDIPNPGTRLYSTVFAEVSINLPSLQENWSQQPLDGDYCELLFNLCVTGLVNIRGECSGVLQNLRLAEGVDWTKFVLVSKAPGKIWYLQIDRILSIEPSPEQLELIRGITAHIRKELHD